MTNTPTPAEPESLAVLHEQDARELRVLLLGLAKEGAELATLYANKAKDQAYDSKPGAGPAPDCAAAYTNVARSVRQTVMLIQKLTAPAPVAPVARAGADGMAARKQIIRRVEDAIHRDAPEAAAERLHAEFLERMETPEFDDELGQRPVQDIVNDIRADLGLHGAESALYFKRRTPADAAVLCAQAASRGRGDALRPHAALGAALLHATPPIRGP